jgi:ATP-dependent protease ClpP protease subunit
MGGGVMDLMGCGRDYARVHSKGMDFHFYIHGEIADSGEFLDLLYSLQTASPEDTVNIHINSGGGYLDTAVEIINAMRSSAGEVITHAEGMVASAATLIFFSGDKLVVSPFCQFMLHDGSTGGYGKMNENLKSAQSGSERLALICKDVYKYYFTDEEIDRILGGQDYYLLAKELEERCERASELAQEEISAVFASLKEEEDEL